MCLQRLHLHTVYFFLGSISSFFSSFILRTGAFYQHCFTTGIVVIAVDRRLWKVFTFGHPSVITVTIIIIIVVVAAGTFGTVGTTK